MKMMKMMTMVKEEGRQDRKGKWMTRLVPDGLTYWKRWNGWCSGGKQAKGLS